MVGQPYPTSVVQDLPERCTLPPKPSDFLPMLSVSHTEDLIPPQVPQALYLYNSKNNSKPKNNKCFS